MFPYMYFYHKFEMPQKLTLVKLCVKCLSLSLLKLRNRLLKIIIKNLKDHGGNYNLVMGL